MTYKEWLQQESPHINVEKAIEYCCPQEFFENVPEMESCDCDSDSTCKDCWSRELPQEETEQKLKELQEKENVN